MVYLQYQNETKRALLPNEITTMDTVIKMKTTNVNSEDNLSFYLYFLFKVRALFVRSFGQLNMEYFDSPHFRIYIHDPNQDDLFYELEDLRYVITAFIMHSTK